MRAPALSNVSLNEAPFYNSQNPLAIGSHAIGQQKYRINEVIVVIDMPLNMADVNRILS